MIYKTMLERMAEAQPGYAGSPYERLNQTREQMIASYYDKKEPETVNVNFTINGKKVK